MDISLILNWVLKALIENCEIPEERAVRLAQRRGPFIRSFVASVLDDNGVRGKDQRKTVKAFMKYQKNASAEDVAEFVSGACAERKLRLAA